MPLSPELVHERLRAAARRLRWLRCARRGLTGARDIGGNELFDIRTRLQQAVRFV